MKRLAPLSVLCLYSPKKLSRSQQVPYSGAEVRRIPRSDEAPQSLLEIIRLPMNHLVTLVTPRKEWNDPARRLAGGGGSPCLPAGALECQALPANSRAARVSRTRVKDLVWGKGRPTPCLSTKAQRGSAVMSAPRAWSAAGPGSLPRGAAQRRAQHRGAAEARQGHRGGTAAQRRSGAERTAGADGGKERRASPPSLRGGRAVKTRRVEGSGRAAGGQRGVGGRRGERRARLGRRAVGVVRRPAGARALPGAAASSRALGAGRGYLPGRWPTCTCRRRCWLRRCVAPACGCWCWTLTRRW